MKQTPSFSLGMTVITPGALAVLGRNNSTGREYRNMLYRGIDPAVERKLLERRQKQRRQPNR
ncbi:MAG: hypothetical protein GX130_01430 [Candidatus Hydrogenedens sp.]|jgi:hypothetical protein|nr:hypothetical protein [Candidatus Hydrogenedens sp.]